MKTEDTETLGIQKPETSQIKARYSQLTCENCL